MRSLAEELGRIVGTTNVLAGKDNLAAYGTDKTPGLHGKPEAVVFANNATEVSKIIKLARKKGAAIVPRGAGTGLSGGCVPAVRGAIVLSLERMNRILEVDARNSTLMAEVGVITARIDEAASVHGLFYPPDPGSLNTATLGGNIAHNAGGLRGLKYSVTRDYVMGLEVVLADGSIAWLGSKCVKDVAGYALRELFVGSEGTLGVVTKALLKLLPRPLARATLTATFTTLEQAADTVSAIIAARILPCTLEFLDQVCLRCIEESIPSGLPVGAGALLLMETDGHPAAVEDEAARMAKLAQAHGAIQVKRAKDATEAARLTAARREALPSLAKRGPSALLQDVTVPRSELAAMVRFINKTARRHKLECATFGHAGDGNLHPVILVDECDTKAMKRVNSAVGEIMAEAVRLGGTITGEHGVGLAKKAYLPMQRDASSMALLKTVKRALDPKNIMNPGKIFDL